MWMPDVCTVIVRFVVVLAVLLFSPSVVMRWMRSIHVMSVGESVWVVVGVCFAGHWVEERRSCMWGRTRDAVAEEE